MCANATGTVGGGIRTDVSAAAAVVGIVKQVGASSVAAVRRPFDAPIETLPIHASTVLEGTRIRTRIAASSAVVEVAVEHGAGPVATDGPADTFELADPIDARDVLVRTRLGAVVITRAAVVNVIGEIRAGVTA